VPKVLHLLAAGLHWNLGAWWAQAVLPDWDNFVLGLSCSSDSLDAKSETWQALWNLPSWARTFLIRDRDNVFNFAYCAESEKATKSKVRIISWWQRASWSRWSQDRNPAETDAQERRQGSDAFFQKWSYRLLENQSNRLADLLDPCFLLHPWVIQSHSFQRNWDLRHCAQPLLFLHTERCLTDELHCRSADRGLMVWPGPQLCGVYLAVLPCDFSYLPSIHLKSR